MKNKSGIYEILNTVNGKRYVGQAGHFRKRWAAHRWHLRKGQHHCRPLQRAWDKYGEGAFTFRVILTCAPSMLNFYEQQLLDKAKPLYNTCPVAESMRGMKHPPEFGRAISERMKGNTILKGKKLPPEWCAAISAGNMGRTITDEQRAALSEAHIGLARSKESREKQSRTMTGQKKTAEHAANISRGKKGVSTGRQSQEQKDKIRAAMLAFHAAKRAERAALQ